MVDATHKSYNASDRSYYAIIKKDVHSIALANNFSVKRIGEIDIIVAEITSNLHKYAQGGELLVGFIPGLNGDYIEIISIDEGPGMDDLRRMMTDGYSTTNSMGHGLGSIKRLSDEFDIYSSKGWGTILVSRIYRDPPTKTTIKRQPLVALVVAKPGEVTSGDGYYLKIMGNNVKLMLGDGLGHGVEANKAVNQAVVAFKQCPYDSPVEIIRYVHSAVRKTRGLVATFAVFDLKERTLRIAGVGNIAAKLTSSILSKTPLPYNGIIGHNIPNTMNDHILSMNDYPQLVLCSDGMKSRWDINKHPGLNRSNRMIQAVAIYKDFARRTDDMSVVITNF